MERLGIGFDFDVNRLGGKESKGALKRNLCLLSGHRVSPFLAMTND
jgi:hypothetical protein